MLFVPNLAVAGTGICTVETPALLGPAQVQWNTTTGDAIVFMDGGTGPKYSLKGTVRASWSTRPGTSTVNITIQQPDKTKMEEWTDAELTITTWSEKAYLHFAKFTDHQGDRVLYRVIEPKIGECNIEN